MKISPVILALLVLAVPAAAQYNPDAVSYRSLYEGDRASAMKEHVDYLASALLEGRKAGSEGETLASEYIYDRMKAYGVDMLCPREGQKFGISTDGKDTLVSRNILGFIQGYDKNLRDRYVVVGARMDNTGSYRMTVDGNPVLAICSGANGNASGVAMLLELSRMVATNSALFRRSVLFVAFGSSTVTFAGSWYFLNREFASDVSNMDVMVNLDMVGVDNNGSFYASTNANPDMDRFIKNLSGGLQPIKPEIIGTAPYVSDFISFYDKEIPSVNFTTGRYAEHNSVKDKPDILNYELMERELEYVYNCVEALANTDTRISFRNEPATRQEKHLEDVYSYFDCDQKPAFLNNTDPRVFMTSWVYKYLKYPQKAVEQGIQGTVQVNFIIEKDGSVTNATVIKGVDELLDAEALRVVNASPKWKPARIRGDRVRSSMTIGIEFRLEKKSGKRRVGFNNR